MKINEILDAIYDLSLSQGFYGRLLRDLLELKENYPSEWEKVVKELESQNFKTTLDMVLYFEE